MSALFQNTMNGGANVKKSIVSKSIHGRQVLKPTENTRNQIRHDQSKEKKAKKIIPKKTFAIFEDAKSAQSPKLKQECVHAEAQTTSEDCCHCTCHEDGQKEEISAEEEAHRLMVQDDVPEDYWKQLAESRREALEESLIENELLHGEVDELKKENSRLSELAEHAEYFANILKTMTEDEKEETDNVFDDRQEHGNDNDSKYNANQSLGSPKESLNNDKEPSENANQSSENVTDSTSEVLDIEQTDKEHHLSDTDRPFSESGSDSES